MSDEIVAEEREVPEKADWFETVMDWIESDHWTADATRYLLACGFLTVALIIGIFLRVIWGHREWLDETRAVSREWSEERRAAKRKRREANRGN